ncbi:MAG: site-2 protease family protein [Planctomycetota bacterium]
MDFLGRSFKIGRLFDITINIHILFVFWIAYRLISDMKDWQFQFAFLGMLFGIVLVHEFGHCFGARAVGGHADNIMLWPLGGLAYASAPMRPWPQFVTVAAGPLVNVLFCLISGAILIISTGAFGVISLNPFAGPGIDHMTAQWQFYMWLFYRLNLILLCFNLLPIFPMDGGQLFRTIIWPFVGLARATIIAAQLGIVGAIGLAVLGAMTQSFILIGIAIFGGMTSYQHYQAARGSLANERFLSADYVVRDKRSGPGFWARLFGRRKPKGGGGRPLEFPNPKPGAWQAKQDKKAQLSDEVDRILKKVSEHGIQSLSYIERQALERATRQRQEEERKFQKQNPP